MTDNELHKFYLHLVEKLRNSGVTCAITSGLACVHYGVAETTKDCDLLCAPESFTAMLEILSATQVGPKRCSYRGNLSPPLDPRWHRGGWTSHFVWDRGPNEVTLDIFGVPPRAPERWEREISGFYVSPHIVAQMKRTDRDKDWPFITALGVKMLEAGDDRGWMHIYDVDVLERLIDSRRVPEKFLKARPALALAQNRDVRTAGALNAERKLWEQLDHARMKMYARALRPYSMAVWQKISRAELDLFADHKVRVECAQQCLTVSPILTHGLDRFVGEARDYLVASQQIPGEATAWLPDVKPHFTNLN